MTQSRFAPLPSPSLPWVDKDGRPYRPLVSFLRAFSVGNIGPLVSAANDVEAAKAGVPINGIYQANGSVKIRLS